MSKGSSTPAPPESTVREHDERRRVYDQTLELPVHSWASRSIPRWLRPGLSPRSEWILDRVGIAVLVAFAAAWAWSIAHAKTFAAAPARGGRPSIASTVGSALTTVDAPTTAYLTDAALNVVVNHLLAPERGASGKLEATFESAPEAIRTETLPRGTALGYTQGGPVEAAPRGSGIWGLVLQIGNAIKPISNFNVIAMLPFSVKRNGHVGTYYIGSWPSEMGAKGPAKAPSAAYANPAGFIEVTQANRNTPVSEHFKLGDFVTHDQPNVWPKYIVLQQKLIDKLELVLSDLEAHGDDVRGVKVMSGFRSPQYNATGGITTGRANLSRHMYGDAADIYIDDNGDGQMDDLNHDGKITIGDARVIEAAVDRVDAVHPELVGGAGVYTAAPGHGPFIHIDTRGYRARWSGTTGG